MQRRPTVKSTGALGRENVGMSNRKSCESQDRRKPEVSSAMSIIGGLGDPKRNPALSDWYVLWYITHMYYVYVLKKNNSKLLYFGYTQNLEQRNRSHKYDRRKDYELVYYEAFKNKEDAEKREKDLKKFGAGYGHLKKRIARSLE